MEYIYDITDKDNAFNTLLRLSNVNEMVLNHYIYGAKNLTGNTYESFHAMVQDFNIHPTFQMDDLICHLQQMTTSANECKNIKEKGITDLRTTYEDTESELRQFLEEQKVEIDIPGKRIYFNGEDKGSIAYTNENLQDNRKRWSIGRKFYYDFCVCGFFCFNHKIPYGGRVNERPEILFNISEVIGKRIDNIWRDKHKCYVVKFKVPYSKLAREGMDTKMDLLQNAFANATNDYIDDDRDALLKDHVIVPSNDIISISEFYFK